MYICNMKLISEHPNMNINTNKNGKVSNATILKFEGQHKKNTWQNPTDNTFAYTKGGIGYKIYVITGNHKFSICETIPTEVIDYIRSNG